MHDARDLQTRVTATLNSVRWTTLPGPAHECQSSLLWEHRFRHGFVGIGGSRPPDLHHIRQVHGTGIIAASLSTAPETEARADGDALISSNPSQPVAVKTADCLPILIADPDQRTVMAVHAGWRGLTAGIIAKAVAHLSQNGGSPPHRLCAAIGPAIGREAYEVGPEVISALFQKPMGLPSEWAALAAAKGLGDRWHLDLKVAAVLALLQAGCLAQAIEVLAVCTRTAPHWHSFRREGPGFGSNWSWIAP